MYVLSELLLLLLLLLLQQQHQSSQIIFKQPIVFVIYYLAFSAARHLVGSELIIFSSADRHGQGCSSSSTKWNDKTKSV